MTTLSDLLRDSDPAGYEPRRTERTRRELRQRIVHTPVTPEHSGRRALLTAALVGVALVGLAAGGRYWPRLSMDAAAAVRFEVRLAEERPAEGLRAVATAGRTIYLHREAVVTNSDIAVARVSPGDTASTFNVAVTFNAEGAEKMRRASEQHIGRPMAILIDGEIVMAPVVRDTITASAVITGSFSREDAERIVAGIIGR
jgi:preprotein translocase subunit SecD